MAMNNTIHFPEQGENIGLSYNIQNRKRVCEQNRKVSDGRAMEQDDGFGFWGGGVAEVIEVALWTEAADDVGAWGGVNGLALGADRDFAVIADADAGLLAPDEGPPRAGGDGTQDGAFFPAGLAVCGVRGGGEFAVEFVLVDVGQELVEQAVGRDEFTDAVGGEERGEAFLPVVVAAFDFTFGLGCWGGAEGDAVAVEGGAELGEGVGSVGEEEGVVVHVEGQGQAVGLEGAGEEVEVGQEGLAFIESGTDVVAGGVVQEVEPDLFLAGAREEGVRGGVVLPEGPFVADLPAFDGLGRGLVAGVWGELVCDGPASDAGAVGYAVAAAVEFAGAGAVSRGWLGGEEFGEQGGDCGGPVGLVIATGKSGGPGWVLPLGSGPQVGGVKFVEARVSQAEFVGSLAGGEIAAAMSGQEMADEWCGQAFDQL